MQQGCLSAEAGEAAHVFRGLWGGVSGVNPRMEQALECEDLALCCLPAASGPQDSQEQAELAPDTLSYLAGP